MKLLLYCIRGKSQLVKHNNGFHLNNLPKGNWELKEYEEIELNGKIVAECDFEVEEMFMGYGCGETFAKTKTMQLEEILKRSCLSEDELCEYMPNYAIHIKNLHIFDEPKELSDYYTFNGIVNDINNWKPIEKAPQNMMYAYELINELGLSGTSNMQLRKNIVISIRPEWMCLIVNRIKEVEVRRVVLKEMLSNE